MNINKNKTRCTTHLRVCPQRSSHPLGAGVFEDGEGARGGKLIKGGFFWGSHEASRAIPLSLDHRTAK